MRFFIFFISKAKGPVYFEQVGTSVIKGKKSKITIKSVKMKISKKKNKICYYTSTFSCHHLDHLTKKIRFPRPKGVSCSPFTDTHTQTHRQAEWLLWAPFQGFFLQPIIKDWPNYRCHWYNEQESYLGGAICFCAIRKVKDIYLLYK